MSTITTILIFTALALVIRLLSGERWRGWLLLVSSALAVYWLQPVMPLRYMDFWLPSATLFLTVLSWLFTTPHQERSHPQNRVTALVLAGLVLVVGLTRFISYEGILTAARPPQFPQVAGFIMIAAGAAFLFWRFSSTSKGLLWGGIIVLVALFVFIKTPALSQMTSTGLRSLMGQSADMASGRRYPLAGLFLRGIPPDPYPARPYDGAFAAGYPAGICHLCHFLPGFHRRPHRPS